MPQSETPLVVETPHVEKKKSKKPRIKCNAKSKRTGVKCRDWAMIGREKCYHHGGVPSNGGLKHGRNSRLRHVFGEKFDTLATSEELLSFEDDIRLFLARETELLDRVKNGTPDEGVWNRLLELSERRTRLVERAIASMTKIEDAITARYMIVVMGQMLDIIKKEVGDESAQKIARRFELDIIGRSTASDESPLAIDTPRKR